MFSKAETISVNNKSNPSSSNQQVELNYMPSRYSKALNLYSKSQIKVIMPFIASISRTCHYSSLYPICKLVKAVCKIFMMNEIEIIFFAYLIRETEWDIRDKTIYHNAENIQDIIYCSIENLDYKRIILYLLVTAFTVKFYLNEKSTGDILEEVNKRCPNFKQIFQSWNKKHSVVITKINPRTLNTVYKKLFDSLKEDQPDFNMMVDAIIQISPAYNPERDKQAQDPKKKSDKKDTEIQLKKEENFKAEKSALIMPVPAMFSSSGLLNMVALHQHEMLENKNSANINISVSGLNQFNISDQIRRENLGILGSSVIGGLNGGNYDIKEEDDCGELVVGLQDGQSEENIIFEDKDRNNGTNGIAASGFQVYSQSQQKEETPYYTSVINLGRRPSAIGNFGSSEVSVGINMSNMLGGVRREASIVNLDLRQEGEKEVEEAVNLV